MTTEQHERLQQLRGFLDRLLERQNLTELEAATLLDGLASAEMPPALAGAVLAAVRSKGVVAAELRGFAVAMRALARRPKIAADAVAVDIVGTGGDASGSLNLSTGAALLTAACGVGVIKHGNRSVSSRSGSADVLQQLGLALPLDESAAGRCFEQTGFTFLFAPHYHPAMKAIAPIRQALGVRTVFNILGPLTNPAQPRYHVLGAYDLSTARLMAETLSGLPIERSFVVHGAEGWDEPTPIGPFALFDVRPGSVIESSRSPEDYGLARCNSSDLAGGDAATNAAALRAALTGADRGPHRDALLLGTALALEVTSNNLSPRAGIERAAAAIASGAAARLLHQLAAFSRP
ncbi:MAG TPA: anthranilate phosphoribosyltransferase [Steroidobacteraceae bacterium]|nr:anthranilate phosphoribosyltransferase [Steroidobacteraceae bacterium]HRX88050.1 anthranilate phosphoribosyltransferase [Steroidobacteraceae bacterium]